MKIIKVPRLLLSGLSSREQTFEIAIGIISELRRSGVGVSVCVLGPHLQRSVVLKRISGRYVQTLEADIGSYEQITSEIYLASLGAEIILIIGNGALFETNLGQFEHSSDAEIARMLRTPVLLAADICGWRKGLAAALQGYFASSGDLDIAGVLIDNSEEASDKSDLESALSTLNLSGRSRPVILGALPPKKVQAPRVPFGISQANNMTLFPREFFIEQGRLVADSVKMDALLELAAGAPQLTAEKFPFEPSRRKIRIAVSDDVCFNLCFQNNLELLRFFGAKVIPFSPIADVRLPHGTDLVYISGACMADYGRDLQNNKDMKQSLLTFAESGGLIYSEGAGSAYLARRFQDPVSGEMREGVGILDGTAVLGAATEVFFRGLLIEESILGEGGEKVCGIDTQEWTLQENRPLPRSMRQDVRDDSLIYASYSPTPQIFSTFHLLNFSSNPSMAARIVSNAALLKSENPEID